MAARFAWVLNLDADVELAAIASGARGGYCPTRSLLGAMRARAPQLAASLLDPARDRLFDEDSPPMSARGLIGRAFCPTPRALRLLRRVGAIPAPHPDAAALVRANSRAFCASLGGALPGAAFVAEEREALDRLASPPPAALATSWRIKRNFGMAGRGQRVVQPGPLGVADRAFLRGAMAEGGAQIEPDVRIQTELAVHGMLDPAGGLALGPVVEQRCDARGAWLSTAPSARPDVIEPLVLEATRVAAALTSAGYFGPFGVDAYLYRVGRGPATPGQEGAIALQPRSEINARFTMGFALPARGPWGA